MRFITCRLPDGVEDPAILSADGRQVWPLSWLGLSYETLSDAIPFLTPQVRAGLSLAIAGIPALPIEAVTPESPIPSPAQDVVCLGINYMAHSDEAEKYSADAFATKHQDAIYFSKRVTRAVPDGGFIEAHTDLVKKLDYECELAVVLGKDAKDVPAGQTKDYVFGYTILNDVSARDVQTASGDTPYALPAVNADPGIYGGDLRKNKGPIGDIRVISAILFNGAGHTALLHPDLTHAEFQQEPFGRHKRDLFFPTAGQKHPCSSLCSSRCAGPGGIPQPQPFAAFCNVLFHRITV